MVLPRKGYLVRPVELTDVRDIFAIRRMFEPALAAEAAASASEKQLTELDRLISRQAEAGPDFDSALGAARSFHMALAAVTGSDRIHGILENLIDEVRRLHHLLPDVESHITSTEELQAHRRLVVALRARDPERARTVMQDHLSEVVRALARGFSGGVVGRQG